MATTKRNLAETIEAFGWQFQRGYVHRVTIEPDADSDLSLGFHGGSTPPCDAEYLYGDGRVLLVISGEADSDRIACLPGVTLSPASLEEGDHYSDGTWEFRVLQSSDCGEVVIAGRV